MVKKYDIMGEEQQIGTDHCSMVSESAAPYNSSVAFKYHSLSIPTTDDVVPYTIEELDAHLEESEKQFMNGEALSMDDADRDMELFVETNNPMPCSFTDEEFKEELALSEASGFVSHDEFKKSCFEKWGVAL